VRHVATAARPLARIRRPAARLRTVTHRGAASAAMVYDDVVLGLMDIRGLDAVFPFLLRRETVTGP
jgi:hypothetical protein